MSNNHKPSEQNKLLCFYIFKNLFFKNKTYLVALNSSKIKMPGAMSKSAWSKSSTSFVLTPENIAAMSEFSSTF